MQRLVAPASLHAFARACFAAAGVAKRDADWSATALVESDLRGISSHGVMRLPWYLHGLKSGKINAKPHLAWTRTGPVTAVLDGDHALGFVSAKEAAAYAVELARETGLGAVAVRRANHCGALFLYAEWATLYGMVGVCCANTHPALAPPGGRKPVIGTNPIAFAAPTPLDYPLSIDLSTSAISRGAVIERARRGEPLPEGVAVDEDGAPTSDPQRALTGALLPIGGAKGYALALMVEVLAGVLAGAQVAKDVGFMFADDGKPRGNGFFYLALHPDFFVGQEEFLQRIASLVGEIHDAPLAKGAPSVSVPGERRHRERVARSRRGIPISDEVWADLVELSDGYGIPLPDVWECDEA
ncbi:MAG: Ldh family oxidoreductase [Alicyclobacillus mali]|uniref:Ldh family oxidoreductase n=1 Tax=Alicyclobacillus mali (ex Roth et al. 2021) TaxID=1123961 RepID=UPI0023F2E947|nr:Ldh family oxidoreductase [Alicyclobacillus mali (ex Roth et al. 2021)]MCL6489792.1 Ldh family oxidoreductase [Alicyclobacillus mali (ex Roth et al. 2021)]